MTNDLIAVFYFQIEFIKEISNSLLYLLWETLEKRWAFQKHPGYYSKGAYFR